MAMNDSYPMTATGRSCRISTEDTRSATAGRATEGSSYHRSVLVWCSAGDPAGGVEHIAISIANGLASCGWRVALMGPMRDAPSLRELIRPEVDAIDHRPEKTAFGVLRTARCIRHIVRERKIDVISAHGSLFPLLFSRIPVVWTEHDMRYVGTMLRGFRGLAWRWIRHLVQQGHWRVVTVSHHVKTRLRENLNMGEDVQVIYNGLPNADSLRALPPPRMVSPFRIGFLGRLTRYKRPLEVFELSARLNAMGISHEWNVFGDGILMPEMLAMAAKPYRTFGAYPRLGEKSGRCLCPYRSTVLSVSRGGGRSGFGVARGHDFEAAHRGVGCGLYK